jgi:hypothetical protein
MRSSQRQVSGCPELAGALLARILHGSFEGREVAVNIRKNCDGDG